MKPISQRQAVILLALTALLWSTGGVFVKILTWHPLGILGARSLGVFLVMILYLKRIDIHIGKAQVAGAVSYVLVQLLFVSATKLTTAANAIFLQYTAPIYVVVLGYWFLKERPQRADWISMPVIFAGLLLFFAGQLSPQGFLGNVLGLLSGITMATITLSLRAQKDGSPAQTVLLGSLLSAVIGLPFIFKESWTPANIAILLYMGIFQLGIAYLFYTMAIRTVPALEATLILALEPVLNPVWVFLVIGEKPGGFALLGGALVVGAIIYRSAAGSDPPLAVPVESQR